MYYEVIMLDGESYCFRTVAEYEKFIAGRDDVETVMVRGEFPSCDWD